MLTSMTTSLPLKVSFSHMGLFAHDAQALAAFYCRVLAAGIVWGDRFPGQLPEVLAGTLFAGLFLRGWKGGAQRTILVAAGVFAVLGYVSLQPWVTPLLP